MLIGESAVYLLLNVVKFYATRISCPVQLYIFIIKTFVMNTGVETFGKNAVVCGRSKNVGLPIAVFLHGDGERGNNSGEYSSCVEFPI